MYESPYMLSVVRNGSFWKNRCGFEHVRTALADLRYNQRRSNNRDNALFREFPNDLNEMQSVMFTSLRSSAKTPDLGDSYFTIFDKRQYMEIWMQN